MYISEIYNKSTRGCQNADKHAEGILEWKARFVEYTTAENTEISTWYVICNSLHKWLSNKFSIKAKNEIIITHFLSQ